MERKVVSWEIDIDLDDVTVDRIKKMALERIKNDTPALVNYGANIILKEYLERQERCSSEKCCSSKGKKCRRQPKP